MSQNMEKIQAEQKTMKSQDSELSQNLKGLREDLSNLHSQGFNERHTALRALGRLQEEVAKLWIELRTSNGECVRLHPRVRWYTRVTAQSIRAPGKKANGETLLGSGVGLLSARTPGVTPGEKLPPTLPIVPTTVPTTVPATVPAAGPATVPTTVPATVPAAGPATGPTTLPTTAAPLSLSSTPGSTCNTCPEQWVSFQKKCYYFGEGPKKWIEARFACSKLQGRLVSIHSQEEQDFLTKRANKKGSWIGLRDLNIEGEFVWMDENPLDYSNWQPGEPNNEGEGEDCVMMQGSGRWNDAFCLSRLDGWVCDRLATC
ncbi:hypothetical protein HPG69_013684 [Diceros bicornis minor]|uniref:C-type lectin domain-containing protein n=1 Tax=Diceros bicornis minor TaxID=77932 RepID=A0A7J7FNC0_DICBM|nr:hypothetical protein HPG69_013684 [Diceros bicornis minor]